MTHRSHTEPECEVRGCTNPPDGLKCEACMAQLRRQEPDVRTVMDGRGPRGW